MFLIGFEDNLIPIHHFFQLFFISHFTLTILFLVLLWRWGLKILLNLRPVIDNVMVAICDHSQLLLLWTRLLLLLVILTVLIIVWLFFLLWKIFLLLFLLLDIQVVIIIWGTFYLMLAVYYFVLFIVFFGVVVAGRKEPVTVCPLWGLFWILFVEFILAGVEFWQIYRLFILKCLRRVVLRWWRNLAWKKFAFVILMMPLILLCRLTPSMWLLVLIQQRHQFLLLFFYILL